jgi:hypothetical protein
MLSFFLDAPKRAQPFLRLIIDSNPLLLPV